MRRKLYFPLLLLILAAIPATAKVALPSILSSNMVLQQQASAKLWGKARPGAKITVAASWNNKTYKTTVDGDSCWLLQIPTPAAGGPYEISISDGEPTILTNVMVGEVWFCVGQSNMEMPMRGFDRQPMEGGNDVILKSTPDTPIRIFNTDVYKGTKTSYSSRQPQTDIKAEWTLNSPENVASTSAVAYFFAKYVQDIIDVPVGIIISTLGGSRIEPWMSGDALALCPDARQPEQDMSLPITDAGSDPSVLYNAKVSPFVNFRVKGMLWYQGESNCPDGKLYARLLPAFVNDLRQKWQRPDMPFYYVEIAPFNYDTPEGTQAAMLREAQCKLMQSLPGCGMATTLDIGNPVFIHPVDKATVGKRLAWWALGQTYGMNSIDYAPPTYRSMEISGNKIYINVDNAPRGLCPMWTRLDGFEIAGSDRIFHPANAEIETESCRLAVSSPEVSSSVAVRYAFHNYATAHVFGTNGLPLVPFRTDNWND